MCVCACVFSYILRGSVSVTVHVGSEQSVRQDSVSLLGAAL